jgi:hypothetical protein
MPVVTVNVEKLPSRLMMVLLSYRKILSYYTY